MDEWTEPHRAAKCLPDLSKDRMQEERGYSRETLSLPSLEARWHTLCLCCVPWDVLQTLPHNLQWSLRIHAGHKDLTVLLTKGKQKRVKYHIGNVTRQSFPPCSCVDVVKKFNGTEDLSTDWNLRWELPSSSVPRDLQRELTYTFCASEFLTSALQGKEIDLTLPTLWINGGTTIITRTTKLQRRQLGEETKVQPITTYSLLSHHQAYNSTSTFIYPFYRWGN